ncbi:hypothetical protein [Acinetobacter sp. CE-15]|uniref:hypothetical protein n=1 Tax=Acinetobacter sp. CE-15 TaxID=3425693 RepID=UPI003DA50177
MIKVTLKEKLNKAICKVVLASIIFFIFGAILKSDGPKLDVNKIYELAKDTLSFCAAFVGPVIAYVLFNDWRQEHLEKKLENDSEIIIKNINQIMRTLINYLGIIVSGEKESEERGLKINNTKNILLLEIDSVIRDINRLNKTNEKVVDFIDLALTVSEKLKESTGLMYRLDRDYQMSDNKFSPSFTEIDKSINKLNGIINQLNNLQINLKIGNLD